MDVVTHALLGATIAEVGFRGKLGGKALAAAAVLAMAPDADVFTRYLGPWEILRYHRGPTHSLVVLAVAAPAIGWLLWRIFRRRGSFAAWSLLAFAATASNPVLDWFTSFGTQLLWPITHHRFALDAVSIVDVAVTLPLALAVVAACIPRLAALRRKFVPAMLVVAAAYLAVGLALTLRAQSAAAKQLETEGFRVARVRACPMMGVPFLRHVVAMDAEGNLRVAFVSTLVSRPVRFDAFGRASDPLVAEAFASDAGRLFNWFADGYVSAEVERHPGGATVLLEDHRYGWVTTAPRSFLGALAEFDADGKLVSMEPVGRRERLDRWAELHAGWRLTFGEGAVQAGDNTP